MRRFRLTACLIACCFTTVALPQLRVVTWNITNYGGTDRVNELRTAIYGTFEGRSMSPDILICQEFLSASAFSAFLTVLNFATGSPGDWAAAPFVNGPDTDSAFFYRTSKVDYLGMTVVSVGGTSPNHPRNIQRYDFRPVGYTSAASIFSAYSSHMKSQDSGTDDDARRLLEATKIREDAQSLPNGRLFLLGGDFNIQTSAEAAYQKLVGSETNNAGRFFDPISTPGNWNNNANMRFVHTQDPVGTGGMDDRFDQILLSANLLTGSGFTYLGSFGIPYSTTTWNDPNHSYRAWGNDGTSFDGPITTTGNTMVGATIAQALQACAGSGGHLPVFLDIKVAGKVDATGNTNFGSIPIFDPASETLLVGNGANVALWTTNGISNLSYSISASGNVSTVAGSHTSAPGATANQHTIVLDTDSIGQKTGQVTLTTNDPDNPTKVIQYTANVYEPVLPSDYSIGPGSILSGNLSSIQFSDDIRMVMRPTAVAISTAAPIQFTVIGHAVSLNPSSLTLRVEGSASVASIVEKLFLFNFNSQAYEEVSSQILSVSETTRTIDISTNPARFIAGNDGEIRLRATYKASSAVPLFPWQVRLDQVLWTLN